jgi:hypothetical protein
VKKLKRMIGVLAICLGMVMPTLAMTAAPATAGQDEWTYSPCRMDVQWYNQTGVYGTYYYWDSNPPNVYFVGGNRMNAYQNWNYQCGTLGPPTSELFQGYIQWFQNGYIKWEPGNYYQPNGCWYVFYGANQTKDWACY